MTQVRTRKPVGSILVIVVSTAAAIVASASAGSASARPVNAGSAPASAASALLYDYEFASTTGTVPNSAPDGPDVPLTLQGTWSQVPDGVDFSGNTTGDLSVAYGQPADGFSLDEPPAAAVGFGARILYYGPATGRCFGDTPNITQIGRFSKSPYPTQAKIQLSSCGASQRHVLIECRLAGSLTNANQDHPVASTMPLVNGRVYNVSCVKSPDQGHSATITLTVTRVTTGQTVTNTFKVGAFGTMRSRSYISAGNKYPLPSPAQNTDQFNGHMTRTVYCAGTMVDVTSCLQTYLPAS